MTLWDFLAQAGPAQWAGLILLVTIPCALAVAAASNIAEAFSPYIHEEEKDDDEA